MPIILKDRVKVTSSVTGTGTVTLGSAAVGYQDFSAIGNGNITYYVIALQSGNEWEVGKGTVTESGGTWYLSRDTVYESSAGGTLVNFSSGAKDVFVTYPSERAIYEEPDGNTLVDGGPLTVVGTGVTSYTSFTAVLAELYGNVNSFAQVYAQNLSDGDEASADIVAYNDLGDGLTNFVDVGINSSNYNSATYPIFTPSSAYLFNDGGEMFIGSATDDVVLFAGGVDPSDEAVRINATTKALTTVSDVSVGGVLDVTGAVQFGSTVLLNQDPITALQAATKQYVDQVASAGLHIHSPVRVETTGNLTATYAQGGTTFNITDITSGTTLTTSVNHGLVVGDQIWLYGTAGNGLVINTAYYVYSVPALNQITVSASFGGAQLTGLTNASGLTYATRANSGVGATLTNAGAQAALVVDNITMAVNDRVMVRLQTTGYENGVYVVSDIGSGSTNWVLTRADDSDIVSPEDPNTVGEGDYYYTREGQLNAGDSHVLTTPNTNLILGYTPLTFTQFSGAVTYTGGTNINVTGQVISLDGTIAATNGGTGTNTVATGDLLYGSGTNTWSKLAAGPAYKSLVMNGAGTMPEWNAVALNESGAVSGALPTGNGGTGITTYTIGDLLYCSATNTLAKLAGNTSSTKLFLSQTGTGAASDAPVWSQIAASEVSGLAASATTDTTNAANISSGTLPSNRLIGSYANITGVGTLSAGTWNADVIAAQYGGTGQSSYTQGDILYASSATTIGKLADVATGNALLSGGVGADPSWGKIGLQTHVDGTLQLANGGTGQTSAQEALNAFAGAVTAGQYLRGNGTNVVMSAIQASDIPTLNQNTTGSAGSVANALTAGTGVSYSSGTTYNGSAAITISIGQGVGTSANVQFNSIGVNTAASGTAGEIRATNNVTAYYSDERLKTKIGEIENALDKVCALSGFYYEANEVAQALGYSVQKEVGVSAQQVQAVLPEAVAPAPIDEKYLTVRYERIVPLLIEAIKEIKVQLDEIKRG